MTPRPQRMRRCCFLLLLWQCQIALFGQTYTISTVAGNGGLQVNVTGTSVSLTFETPKCLTSDEAGDLYFPIQNSVLRWDATTRLVTLVAGSGTSGSGGDGGPAANAQLSSPCGLAVDHGGNLYIADAGNNR